MMKKEIEITLMNGSTVQLFKHEGNTVLSLVDSNSQYVSQTQLTETEKKTLKEVVNNIL